MTAQETPTTVMRQVVVAPGAIEVVRAEAPRPGAGQVLVRSVLAGVCGSDTHAAAGLHPWISLPYVPGHEVVGVVAETGVRLVGAAGPARDRGALPALLELQAMLPGAAEHLREPGVPRVR